MFRITASDLIFIGRYIEGFLYGIYSGIFAIYLQCQVSRKDANKTQNVIFYSICTLYVLSVVLFVIDTAQLVLRTTKVTMLHIDIIQITLFGCCDFIAQFILIYRCWIVWTHNIRVVIVPSILAIAFLVLWLFSGGFVYMTSYGPANPYWAHVLGLSGFALSLTVNAVVTGLIVFRIFKVFREVRTTTSDDRILGATGGNKLRGVIFTLIESGMALFSIQLVRVVIGLVGLQGPSSIIIGIHEMLTGITPTFILVRTSMGLSFDEDKSMEEVAIGSLRFVSSPLNSVLETGSNNIEVGQDRRDDDDIGIRQDNEIEVVAR